MHCFSRSKDRKVRVIHLGEAAGLGGLQNWVCSLAEAQARRGFEVQLMQPPGSPRRTTYLQIFPYILGISRGLVVSRLFTRMDWEAIRIRKSAEGSSGQ